MLSAIMHGANVKRLDSASGLMTSLSCFKFPSEVDVNISCGMPDSVNLFGICVLTQLHNLPLLSVTTSCSALMQREQG